MVKIRGAATSQTSQIRGDNFVNSGIFAAEYHGKFVANNNVFDVLQDQKEMAARAELRFFLFSATIRDFLPQKATELQNFATTR